MGFLCRTFLFLSLAVASVNGRKRHSCGSNGGVPAYYVFKKCYEATFDLIRRGFAHDIATAHFQKALFEVSKSVLDSEKNPRFGSVCVPQEVYGRIFSVRWTTVLTETALNDMLLSISNSFYNPREEAVKIYRGSWKQRWDQFVHWWGIRWQLRKPFKSIDPTKFKFPPTIRHVQDPEHASICIEWKRHFRHPTTPAIDGLRKVLRIVVYLLSVGCDPNGSWQILRHYTVLVYVGIRCKRKEKKDLHVPDQYFQDYSAAALQLMSNAEQAGKLVPFTPSSDHVFEILYGFIYERLATFGAWGVADMTFDSHMVVKNLMVFVNQSVHVEPEDLTTVLRSYGIHPVVRKANGGGKEPDCKSKKKNTNEKLRCETENGFCYWKHDKKDYRVASWYENCCRAMVCRNALAISPTVTSYAECCRVCNQYKGCKPRISKSAPMRIPHVTRNTMQVIHIYLNV